MWGILGNGVQVKITEQRMLVNEFFFFESWFGLLPSELT